MPKKGGDTIAMAKTMDSMISDLVGTFAQPASSDDKTAQGCMGDQAAVLSQELLNPGKLQSVMLDPLLNLLSPGLCFRIVLRARPVDRVISRIPRPACHCRSSLLILRQWY